MPPPDRAADKFLEHLDKHLKTCPICGNATWATSNEVMTPAFVNAQTNSIIPGKALLMRVAVCRKCYFVASFLSKGVEEGRVGE